MLMRNVRQEMRPVASIIVERETRQRKDIEADVAALAEQIGRVGQIQPIVIHEDGRLVAGERRLMAHKKLGYADIRCNIFESLPAHEAFLIEFLENFGRRQLSWQDETRAVLQYHEMRCRQVGGWTQRGTAEDIQLSDAQISRYLAVGKRLDDPEVAGCQTLQGAYNLLLGRADRATAAAQARGMQIAQSLPSILPAAGNREERTAMLTEMLSSGKPIEELVEESRPDPLAILDAGDIAAESLKLQLAEEEKAAGAADLVINADFLDWVETYDGPRFDVIHMDFPYGKGYSGSNTRKTGRAHISPRYADDPDVYWALLAGFLEVQDKIVLPAAHAIFWFDMGFYQPTIDAFESAGWRLVQPFPLIWAKPYQGVASDPRRRPRHCYETALLFSRGDRKLIRLDQDFFDMRKAENLHISQKPVPMLRHFLSLVVDEHSTVFDPTCGSGTALAAAKALGAARILGLELDPDNAEVARFVIDRPVLDIDISQIQIEEEEEEENNG